MTDLIATIYFARVCMLTVRDYFACTLTFSVIHMHRIIPVSRFPCRGCIPIQGDFTLTSVQDRVKAFLPFASTDVGA